MQGTNTDASTDGGRQDRIRVLVVDSTQFMSGLLKAALEQHPQLEVACSPSATDDLTAQIAALKPDVVVVNYEPDRSSDRIKTLRRIVTAAPSSRAIILLDDAEDGVVECFRAGVKGVFRNSQPPQQLVRCIEAVDNGQVWATSADLSRVLQAFQSVHPLRCVNANGENLLSPREKQVVDSIAEGLCNQEIAERLGITEHTVKNHLFKIYNKLGISTRVELILFAVTRHGVN